MNFLALIVCLALCGFGKSSISTLTEYFYAPQSGLTVDDTQHNATLIIVAFADINTDGTISMSPTMIPCTLIQSWRTSGKKVMFSIGGQNAIWDYVFASSTSMNSSIASIVAILNTSPFQGVDLDIQDYSSSPFIVANYITQLKSSLKGYYLSLTVENVGVYQGQTVPTPSTWTNGSYWNYWVPTLNQSISSIDVVQVMAYNNWYDGLSQGTLQYFQDTTLQWLNRASSFCSGCSPIPNFNGVPISKLSIGFLASSSAGGPASYANASVVNSYQQWMQQQTLSPASLFIWDSHWDSLNSYTISNTITQGATASPVIPTNDTTPNICSGPINSSIYQTKSTVTKTLFELILKKGFTQKKQRMIHK